MIHFKRAKALASGVTSPMNKGVIITNNNASPSVVTLTALDPTGNSTTITYMMPANTTVVLPLYIRSYTASGGTITVVELN
jgi:hypothetical protein